MTKTADHPNSVWVHNLMDNETKLANYRAALVGLRGMAAIEAAHGSATWANTVKLIDIILADDPCYVRSSAIDNLIFTKPQAD